MVYVTERVLYADNRPYVLPDSLDELQGPQSGVIVLPESIAWTGRRTYDLDNESQVVIAYERILEESQSPRDLQDHISRSILTRVWRRLYLPARLRRAWTQRFPELQA
jgi:hypothetical protein